MIPSRIYADLVGKPFAEGGRGPDAFDCVGLAIEFQRRRGIFVPAHVSDDTELHRQLANGGELPTYQLLERCEPGCIVLLFSLDEGGLHIGMMVDAYRMLHCRREVGSVLEVLSRSVWARRVIGFYRAEVAA